MKSEKNLFNNKTFLVMLSFLLVVVLGAGIFVFEYISAVNEAEMNISSQKNIIEKLESENNNLKHQNSKFESEKAKYSSKNSLIDILEFAIKLIFSLASLATVKIVPSVGFITAL